MSTMRDSYAAAYPDIPADQAKKLLRELNDVEKKRVSTRTAYLKKFGKVLPADRNLRLAQVERRLDIVLALEMARPGEAELDGVDAALVLAPLGAKPGGVVAATVQTTATVVAIDAVQRTATLRVIDGTSETFTVRDDIDLGQRKVGEQVVFSVVERIALEIEPSP